MIVKKRERRMTEWVDLQLGDDELGTTRNAWRNSQWQLVSMDTINCVCVLRVPKILVASVGLVL
jgi:hypothetical protein